MYLTHIDEQGNSSPPILIDNTTASNRAVNIPEFVNISPDGIDQIEVHVGLMEAILRAAASRIHSEDKNRRSPRCMISLQFRLSCLLVLLVLLSGAASAQNISIALFAT